MTFRDKLEDDLIKILIVGDSKVGKTSFVERYMRNCFVEDCKPTIYFDCVTKVLEEHGGQKVKIKVQLWDLAGQDRFICLSRAYYKYARGCIIMFDLTNHASFENIKKWKTAVDINTVDEISAPIPCLLVANKLDLSQKTVSYSEIENACKDLMCVEWTQISVKDGTNVKEAVTYLLDVILNRSPRVYVPGEYDVIDTIQLADCDMRCHKKSCKICH